jgi:hypothetical protein
VNLARCLVTVYRWVLVSGRAASSARSAGRAICGRTGMARNGPVPGVTSSCRAAKGASSLCGAWPTWDGQRRRRTRGGRAQGRTVPAGGCRLGSRIVTSSVAPVSQLASEAEAPLDRPALWRIRMDVCRVAGSQLGSQRWQRLSDARPRPASIGAAKRHVRLHLAPSGDGQSVPSGQRIAGPRLPWCTASAGY